MPRYRKGQNVGSVALNAGAVQYYTSTAARDNDWPPGARPDNGTVAVVVSNNSPTWYVWHNGQWRS